MHKGAKAPVLGTRAAHLPRCAGEAAGRLPLPRLRLSTARGSQNHPQVPVRGDTTTPRQEEMRHQQRPQSSSGHQHRVQPGWTRPRQRPVPPSENPRKTLRSTGGPKCMSGFPPQLSRHQRARRSCVGTLNYSDGAASTTPLRSPYFAVFHSSP